MLSMLLFGSELQTSRALALASHHFFRRVALFLSVAMMAASRRSFLPFIMSFALMTCVRSFTVIHKIGRVERTARFNQRLFLSATATTSSDPPRRQQKKSSNTGGLRRLPVVKAPDELVARARKAAFKVKADRYDKI